MQIVHDKVVGLFKCIFEILIEKEFYRAITNILFVDDIDQVIDHLVLEELRNRLFGCVLDKTLESEDLNCLQVTLNFYYKFSAKCPIIPSKDREHLRKCIKILAKVVVELNDLITFGIYLPKIITICGVNPALFTPVLLDTFLTEALSNINIDLKSIAIETCLDNMNTGILTSDSIEKFRPKMMDVILSIMSVNRDSKTFVRYLKKFIINFCHPDLDYSDSYKSVTSRVIAAANIANSEYRTVTRSLYCELIYKLVDTESDNSHVNYVFHTIAHISLFFLIEHNMLLDNPKEGNKLINNLIIKCAFNSAAFVENSQFIIHLKRLSDLLSKLIISKGLVLKSGNLISVFSLLPSRMISSHFSMCGKDLAVQEIKRVVEYLLEQNKFHTLQHALLVFRQNYDLLLESGPDTAAEVFQMILNAFIQNRDVKIIDSEPLKDVIVDLVGDFGKGQEVLEGTFYQEILNYYQDEEVGYNRYQNTVLHQLIDAFRSADYTIASGFEATCVNLNGKMTLQLADSLIDAIDHYEGEDYVCIFEFVRSILQKCFDEDDYNKQQKNTLFKVVVKLTSCTGAYYAFKRVNCNYLLNIYQLIKKLSGPFGEKIVKITFDKWVKVLNDLNFSEIDEFIKLLEEKVVNQGP